MWLTIGNRSAAEKTTAFVALLHFAPLPYNLLLFAALHRAPSRPELAVIAGFAWLVFVTIV